MNWPHSRRSASAQLQTLILLFGTCVFAVPGYSQNPDFPLPNQYGDPELPDFNIEGAYPVFDLKELPLEVSILQRAALAFRDKAIDLKVREAIHSMQPVITESFGTTRAGYLIRTNLYVDEFGTAYVPGGQLVTPIGVGVEPVDALAEFDMRPQLTATIPSGLRNQSFYIWMVPKNGKLTATVIPQDFRANTERAAQQEATRRRQLGMWERAVPVNASDNVRRADLWIDAYERAKSNLADSTLRTELEQLNNQAKALQDHMNALYADYRKTAAAMASAQEDTKALGVLTKVLSLVSDGIKFGDIVYGTDGSEKPVSPNSNDMRADAPLNDMLQYRRTSIQNYDNLRVIQDLQIIGDANKFRDLEQRLRSKWGTTGLQVPDPPPIPIH